MPKQTDLAVAEELRRANDELVSVLDLIDPDIEYAPLSERQEAGTQLRHAIEQLDFVLERHRAVIAADPELAKQAAQSRAAIAEMRKLLQLLGFKLIGGGSSSWCKNGRSFHQ
jgi:hypothetical protein